MELVELGVITRPHGFKGHFVVASHAGRDSALGHVKEVFLSDTPKPHKIIEASWMPSGWKLHVEGITSDTEVNVLRGEKILARKADLPAPSENEYYVGDLVGMEVKRADNNERVGIFTGVEVGENGIQWWKVKGEQREWLLPPKKHFIEKIETETRTIWVQHWDELP